MEADGFILGGVVDAILADELYAALGIALVDAHGPRRKWNSQRVFLTILELDINFHRLFGGLARGGGAALRQLC